MRYAAPADVTGINLTSGPLTVVDGFVDVPDDATPSDLGGLATYGFVIAPADAAQVSTKAEKAPAPDPEPAPEPTE